MSGNRRGVRRPFADDASNLPSSASTTRAFRLIPLLTATIFARFASASGRSIVVRICARLCLCAFAIQTKQVRP